MAVRMHWWLRIAQALGFPVVPEVKIRQDRSAGEDFVAGGMGDGRGREVGVRRMMLESGGGGGIEGKA